MRVSVIAVWHGVHIRKQALRVCLVHKQDRVSDLHVVEKEMEREEKMSVCRAEFEFVFSKLLLEEPRRIRRYNRARADKTKSRACPTAKQIRRQQLLGNHVIVIILQYALQCHYFRLPTQSLRLERQCQATLVVGIVSRSFPPLWQWCEVQLASLPTGSAMGFRIDLPTPLSRLPIEDSVSLAAFRHPLLRPVPAFLTGPLRATFCFHGWS
ncbi:hypothetical protein PHSY_003688 [Pseudozyma hubeiensis SY62]|uniref:Uncharacterized protein n=1 Tax=Pseudozyma hubeiensis (strain SY62) TaxID=1305764 RepID=R9P3T0_PSEHS|nr:hypothetical protein PHSY_003688 [Pseudozyma hubeiensis SY62]GAC96108.1 hypothetical protein PHSY_003688 [Pseudozyma hubeiensis SY62]